MAIMKAESGARPNATCHNTNGTTDRGLFQINSVHASRVRGNLDSLYDPETNVRVAYAIWSEQGWSPWVTARKLGIK
jgi:soluble lytic murein transglycosylase-like protein